MSKTRILKFICIIILGLIMICSATYAGWRLNRNIHRGNPVSNQPASTQHELEIDISDWKIYKSELFGYSVNYPQDWVFETWNNDKLIILAKNPIDDFYPAVSIEVFDFPLGLDEWAKREGIVSTHQYSKIDINSVPAYIIGQGNYVIFSNNQRIYRIMNGNGRQTGTVEGPIFNRIISTFVLME